MVRAARRYRMVDALLGWAVAALSVFLVALGAVALWRRNR
jgi:hypothetical protein